MKLNLLLFSIILVIMMFLLTACGNTSTDLPPGATDQPVVIDGKTLLETRCNKCHTLDRVKTKKATADEWQALVSRMISKGAVLSADEQTLLVQYLAETYK